MSNIVKFPRASKPPAPEPVQACRARCCACRTQGRRPGLVAGLVKFVWVATVLVWPVLKWVLAIITFFQFVRMLYHWNTPGVYAGWSFLAYVAALTAVTYFVAIYKPKGL
nr:kleE protein - Enterobacter aerogenes plasmid R751 [Klebsiella aerogenes]